MCLFIIMLSFGTYLIRNIKSWNHSEHIVPRYKYELLTEQFIFVFYNNYSRDLFQAAKHKCTLKVKELITYVISLRWRFSLLISYTENFNTFFSFSVWCALSKFMLCFYQKKDIPALIYKLHSPVRFRNVENDWKALITLISARPARPGRYCPTLS